VTAVKAALRFDDVKDLRAYLTDIKFPVAEDGETVLMKEGRAVARGLKRLHSLN